jgi:hypothetical protein
MAEKSEITGTEVWRIWGMRKSCHLHISNFDRSFLGIENFLTQAMIVRRVSALKN